MFKEKVLRFNEVYEQGGVVEIFGVIFRRLLKVVRFLLPRHLYAKLEFVLVIGYWPMIKNPRSFNEKIISNKFKECHRLASCVVDKWAVREYVLLKTGQPEILNEVIFLGRSPADIPFNTLPNKFVIKMTHGSGWNVLVHDKVHINSKEIINKCVNWMGLRYSVASGNYFETHYDQIVPQVMIEKYIDDDIHGIPLDYKFFCFHGKPYCIQVDIGRFVKHKRNFYDVDWNELPFRLMYLKGKSVPRPVKLKEMLEISEKLSKDFDFCRVDLYSPNNKTIIFGEITLVPGSGCERFYPRNWDFILGEKW